MRQIPLKKLKGVTTVDTIEQLFKTPVPTRSFTYADAALVVDILDALKKANGVLVLEDAQHAKLSAVVQEFQFAFMNEELAEVLKDIVEAPKYEAPQKEAPNG